MFYYGLDFHDLAPNYFLHISAFIVMCEALLRIPHTSAYGSRYSIFPMHAECGGAMVSKLPNVVWPKGAFVETVKVWQQEWFYITEPRDAKWAATTDFRSGPPTRLTSWTAKGLDWGSQPEVMMLQKPICNVLGKNTGLANMIQVMLFRCVLPCQLRASPMWEFNPEGPWTL